MTNILYWNIRQFTTKLINSSDGSVVPGIAGLTYATASQQRLALVQNVIDAAKADIICIVEVSSGNGGASDLGPYGNGPQAAALLLQELRDADPTHAAQWRMVPPLWLGSRITPPAGTETVAVLYRGKTGTVGRYFTGPNVWTGGAGGVSKNPQTGTFTPQNYPENYNTFIDDPTQGIEERNIPPTSLYRRGKAENQSAARIFYEATQRVGQKRGRNLYEETGIYGAYRPPYMTSFYEINTATNSERNLTVFSVHAPPQRGAAKAFMQFMADTPEITTAPDVTSAEIKVICGDFNLQFLNANGSYSGVYQPLTGLGYQSLLPTDLDAPADAAALAAFRGYFATHISAVPSLPSPLYPPEGAATRFLWSDGYTNSLSYYPGYGYTSAAKNTDSIDNILVWSYQAQAPQFPLTVMNLVTGWPFERSTLLPAACEPPLGENEDIVASASTFTAPPAPWPLNPTAANYSAGDGEILCSWPNYGRIYSTSDHFPLVTTL
ncbi:hypothetical protein H4S14_000095 [Agrobacterium vitis]|nr:hypothetical protein [Agrobacterium vitis]MBE1436368.1 hypothetical protein [Agrobacterium vitis]